MRKAVFVTRLVDQVNLDVATEFSRLTAWDLIDQENITAQIPR